MTAIQYNIDNDGILTLTIDMPGQSANTMNAAFREALTETVQKVEGDAEKISGIIITSAKDTFFAGGDLEGTGCGYQRERRGILQHHPVAQGADAEAGDPGQAGSRSHERHCPGWRLRALPRQPPAHFAG